MPEKQKPLDYIDYAKGIGILLVMLGHVKPALADNNNTAQYFINLVYSFHMPLFFVITGMLIKFKENKTKKGEAARLGAGKLFVRLMIPYIAGSAAYMLISFLRFGNEDDHLADMLMATYTTIGIAPLWFLAALFFARLLFHLLKYGLKIDARYILAGSLYLTLLADNLYKTLKKAGPLKDQLTRYLTVPVLRLFPSVFFIAFGYLIFSFINTAKKRQNLTASALLWAVLMVSAYYIPPHVNMHTFMFDDVLYFLLTGMTGSAALILGCALLPQGIKALRTLGKNSMTIMVIHYEPLPFIIMSGDIVYKITGGRNFILIWAVLSVTVIALLQIYRLIKKLFLNALGKIKGLAEGRAHANN